MTGIPRVALTSGMQQVARARWCQMLVAPAWPLRLLLLFAVAVAVALLLAAALHPKQCLLAGGTSNDLSFTFSSPAHLFCLPTFHLQHRNLRRLWSS